MKLILMGLVLTLSTSLFAKTDYTIQRGSLHRGGWINVEALEVNDLAHMKINYKVNPKRIIPGFFKEYLSGDHIEKLPKDFLDESAYINLEQTKEIEIKDAFVYHQGRVDYGRYLNCHKILIKAKNEKSEIIAYYHPTIADAGWAYISLTIKKIPVIRNYNLQAKLKE